MRSSTFAAVSALAATATAADNYLGFNSGSTKTDNTAKFQADFEAEFTTAQGLENAPGLFNAVRLYTNIQAYSKTDPIEAFQAAINTNTSILLGIWTSGTTSIDNELTAINNAITKFGSKFTDRVIGISIGSEDLYRNSVTGVENESGVGADPSVIVKFIEDYKKSVASTGLKNVPIGHVDTWDVWSNSSNKAVIDAVDWIGVDEYPYYENGKNNTIKNAGHLFDTAFDAAVAAANGKPIWLTETGWPVTGPTWDLAVPSVENAQYYWQEIGCRRLFNKYPTFWYNIRDSNGANKQAFEITEDLSTKPSFDLTCPTVFDTVATSTDSSSSATGTSSSGASATGSGSSSNSTNSANTSTVTKASTATTGASTAATASGTAASTTSSTGGAAPTQMAQALYVGGALVAGALAFL